MSDLVGDKVCRNKGRLAEERRVDVNHAISRTVKRPPNVVYVSARRVRLPRVEDYCRLRVGSEAKVMKERFPHVFIVANYTQNEILLQFL
jgi:hypothetical protein